LTDARSQQANSTAVDVSLTFARQFFAGIAQLIIVVIVSRVLGLEQTGSYGVALIFPAVLVQLLNAGMPAAAIYYVASDQSNMQIAWQVSRNFGLTVVVLGSLLGFSVLMLLGDVLFPNIPLSIMFASVCIFPFSLFNQFASAFFLAKQNFRSYNIVLLVQPITALMLVVALWYFDYLSVLTAILSVAFAHFFALTVALILLAKIVNLIGGFRTSRSMLGPMLRYGVQSQIGNILTFLNYRLDIVMVNVLTNAQMTGAYVIAVKLVEQLSLVSQAFSTIVFPRLSAMAPDESRRKHFAPLMTRAVLLTTLVGAILLWMVSEKLVDLVFGVGFSAVNAPFVWLLPGVVFLAGARIMANELASKNMVGTNLVISGGVLLINASLNYALIPLWGISGAAIATTIAYTLFLMIYLAIQKFAMNGSVMDYVVLKPNDFAVFARIGRMIGKRVQT